MTFSKFIPKSFLIPMVAAFPLFMSCKDEKVAEQTPAATQEATLEQKKQALENAAPASTTINAASNGGAVNPPHGQPGHDCKIPVGAPLNGAAGGTNATSMPAMNQTKATPAAISGNGVNPPHGQPGHRCDIKVGDPL